MAPNLGDVKALSFSKTSHQILHVANAERQSRIWQTKVSVDSIESPFYHLSLRSFQMSITLQSTTPGCQQLESHLPSHSILYLQLTFHTRTHRGRRSSSSCQRSRRTSCSTLQMDPNNRGSRHHRRNTWKPERQRLERGYQEEEAFTWN